MFAFNPSKLVRNMLQFSRFMATKSILLAVADPQVLADTTQALDVGWEAIAVASDTDALAQLEERSFDAVLVDFNLGSPDASDLLNHALEKRPDIVRFLFAYEADLALVAAKVLGSPHILPKPSEPASLKKRLEEGVNDSSAEQNGADTATEPGPAPAIPSVYAVVLKAIESLGVTDQQVGEIIAQDEALSSELVRLTNSSYLGLPSDVSDPVEAVRCLGFETVKGLVMALQFLAEHGRLKPAYLCLDQLWQHSVKVGQIARDLVLFETKDRTLASQALIAGLLHDLGKVVLATNFADLYGRVHSLARKQPVTLWDVEKEMFGANHGEIGACLIGMWNMPGPVVDATALHHEPPLGEQERLTPLAAVHIANVLEHQLSTDNDGMMVAPIINTAFLDELGLLQRLPVWRAAFANHHAADLEPDVELVETEQPESSLVSDAPAVRTANHLPGPATTTHTTTSPSPTRPAMLAPRFPRRWIYGGVVAGVLALLAVWLNTQPELNQTEPVYARTPNAHREPAAPSSVPSPEIAPAPAPQETPAVAAAEEPPAPPAPSATTTNTTATLPASEPTTAAAPAPPVTNVPPPTVAPPEKVKPEFRLQGIIFTSVRPSAMINGETVNVGEQIDGASVVAISRTTVTLQVNGQRKTYQLK
jgi:HD-like signal output (HDOD) protein/ActR/RegA family two-component response regulator